jgi:hypothetical protein
MDRHLAGNPGLVVVDPPVEEAVERQLVIGHPAVGVDDRVQLELLQLGLAPGGAALP